MVEASEIGVKRTLEELQVNRSSFYEWYRRYRQEGYDGLALKQPHPKRFWNKIPDHEKEQIVSIALERLEDTPRQLAWHITDTQGYFISESSVYRILKEYDLVPSPNYIVMAAADQSCQRAVADGFHLLQDHQLGLVLFGQHLGRSLPLHYCLEAVHVDGDNGCQRTP